jgi:hypothetical protein
MPLPGPESCPKVLPSVLHDKVSKSVETICGHYTGLSW